MNLAERRFIHARIALVETLAAAGRAECGAAIADVVLGAGQDGKRVRQIGPLESADRRFTKLADHFGILREAFVGSAPPDVLWDGYAGTEGPLDSSSADLLRCDALHFFHQGRIARAAQADMVGKNHGAEHIIVAMHRVDTVEDGDPEAGFFGMRLQTVIKIGPGLQAVAFLGVGVAAA